MFKRNIKKDTSILAVLRKGIRAEESANYTVTKSLLLQCISREHLSFFVFCDGNLGAWDQHENKSVMMIHSYRLQTFVSYLIVEIACHSIAAVVWMIWYIKAVPTVDTFPTAVLFRYTVGVSICCLTFLWLEKC